MKGAAEQAGAALPLACAFLKCGGRLMLNPEGKLETGGKFAWMFSQSSPREARRSYIISRRFYRRLRNPRFERSVAALVAMQGKHFNNWLVLEQTD